MDLNIALPQALDCRAQSLSLLDRSLAADRFGEIRAIIVDEAVAGGARAVIERCWHDAAVITSQACHVASRAA